MPSVRYYNQTAPFWDFIASMEEQGSQHPIFGGPRGESDSDNEQYSSWGAWPFGRIPHRGRHAHPPLPGPPGPPPAPENPYAPPPPPSDEKNPEAGPSEPRGPGPHRGRFGRHGGCHGRGSRGGPFNHGQRPFWTDFVRGQFFDEQNSQDKNEDFKPDADVFDTAESFVIHVALPGAKKDDTGVSWDAEKSELTIAGVIHRPGDEEFLKTLAMNERKVGAFEKKIRLGSRASPAQVDSDAITAKLEDGVLIVEVPKLDSGYVEIKKVDIE